MSSQKPRIVPWLISQIDSKKYPGLEWVNSEHTQFKVPWKHALRQDRSSDDFKIFEAWAIASGCYDPLTGQPDPARWKRNFRSALIQKDDIHMIANCSSDSVNPYKIYEIKAHGAVPVEQPNSANANPALDPISSNNQIANSAMGTLYQDLEFLNLYQDEEELYRPFDDFHTIMEQNEPNKAFFPEKTFHNNITLPEEHLDGATAAAVPVFQEEQVLSQLDEDQETFQQKIMKHFSNYSFHTDFEVKIYYRGNLVHTTTVTNPNGFFITAERQPGHGGYLDSIYLPQPASVVTDRLLVLAVNRILRNLKEGTLVEVREGVICAKRFGYCRSYWSMTNTPRTNIPNKIEKTEYSILYSIHQFITELIEFVEQRRKESPQYSIWICLGEEWPDVTPWQKKCIMVQVTPVAMRLLHELSYSTGASSLDSDINLEISDSSNNTSSLVSLLKSIEDMMDCQ
ncbi:interferon regulatory factor 3-like [Leptodactylus fuscus]|uniref:interferon regulatory factor 3-like n=1 Tax=Leptodactylus fuscus TaxID=238119 RepID=UPI003F4E9F1F